MKNTSIVYKQMGVVKTLQAIALLAALHNKTHAVIHSTSP